MQSADTLTQKQSASSSGADHKRHRGRRVTRWIVGIITAMVLLVAALLSAAYWMIAASKPTLDGVVETTALTDPIEIARDNSGVPILRGRRFEDVVFAQGFVHGQDRFFQMDLYRRHAAGELAALLGPAGLASDRRMRRFNFAEIAERVVARMPPEQRRLFERYADGVNAAMNELSVDPPEYLLLRAAPEPWTVRDSVLVQFALFDLLHQSIPAERAMLTMRQTMPDALVDFLTPDVSRFDAPMIEPDAGQTEAPPAIPGPDVVDLRDSAWNESSHSASRREVDTMQYARGANVYGSNSWAVADMHTEGSGAMLANDPHLPLSVPNTWYRVEMRWAMDERMVGASIPGAPGVIVGSNGRVAWGVTNVQGDFEDLIVVEVDPDDAGRYLTADGSDAFRTVEHTITVHGEDDVTIEVNETRWGPVIGRDHLDRPLALQWTALHPSMVSFDIVDMHAAADVPQAVNMLRRWWGPPQNMMLADADGRVGWVVTGFLPDRGGRNGSIPTMSTDPDAGWRGPLDETKRPVLIEPERGVVYSANNRTLPVDQSRRVGRMWAEPFRTRRIAEMLREPPDGQAGWTERDMLAMQLDTQSDVHAFYQELIVSLAEEISGERGDDSTVTRAADVARQWTGRAAADDRAMRLLVAFRRELHQRLIRALTAPARRADPDFAFHWLMREEPIRRILEMKPTHLLPSSFESWEVFLTDALDTTIEALEREHDGRIDPPWGKTNRLAMTHPISEALPAWMARRLDMDRHAQAGNRQTVRVASPRFATSMRLVVRPGREEDGLFHMPGGQSGHVLSPFYRDGHGDWREGRATPLLAGPPQHRLILAPPGWSGTADEPLSASGGSPHGAPGGEVRQHAD